MLVLMFRNIYVSSPCIVSLVPPLSNHILFYLILTNVILACTVEGQRIPVGDIYTEITKGDNGDTCKSRMCQLRVSTSHDLYS